jgi:hypothetical protein
MSENKATIKYAAFFRQAGYALLFSTKCHLFHNFILLCSSDIHVFSNRALKFRDLLP